MFLFFTLSLFSDSISGIGYGKTVKEAKKEALGDVSSNIGGMVSSSFTSKKLVSGYGSTFEKKLDVSVESSYPILKPRFSSPKKEDGLYKITATLDSRFSSKSYKSEMKHLKKEILQTLKNANRRKGEVRKSILKTAILKFNRFQKLSAVARAIDIRNIPFLTISKSEIESKLAETVFSEKIDFVTTKKMKAELKTNKKSGKFKLYESLKLYVKLSKAGYYYIVNYSITDSGDSYSYIIEFNPDENGLNNKKRFIRKIENHQINRWILIADMEVSEPLGKEYLEIFARKKFFTKFPDFQFDSTYNLFKLTGKGVVQNIQNLRGMIVEEKISTGTYKFSTSK